MKRKACMVSAVFVVTLFFVSCVTSLQTYKPSSLDEANIKEFFISMEKAWNNRDITGVLVAYHDNASIMSGKEKRMFSKKEYANRLEGKVVGVTGLKESGDIKYGAPKIRIYKNQTVEVNMNIKLYEFRNVTLKAKFILILFNNSWLIKERTYTY